MYVGDIDYRPLGWLALAIYPFVEALLLSWWGTTPGKALLRVRVRKNDGRKLSYAEALSRSYSVWTRGLGLGIPLVSLFTLIGSEGKLRTSGRTSWDGAGGYVVGHQQIGALRIIAAVAIGLILTVLSIWGTISNP